jgi:tyrosinase
MIDKMWFDWQLRNPTNAQSFFGGSVQALESLDRYTQYPNGAPPYLDVSVAIFRSRSPAIDL